MVILFTILFTPATISTYAIAQVLNQLHVVSFTQQHTNNNDVATYSGRTNAYTKYTHTHGIVWPSIGIVAHIFFTSCFHSFESSIDRSRRANGLQSFRFSTIHANVDAACYSILFLFVFCWFFEAGVYASFVCSFCCTNFHVVFYTLYRLAIV